MPRLTRALIVLMVSAGAASAQSSTPFRPTAISPEVFAVLNDGNGTDKETLSPGALQVSVSGGATAGSGTVTIVAPQTIPIISCVSITGKCLGPATFQVTSTLTGFQFKQVQLIAYGFDKDCVSSAASFSCTFNTLPYNDSFKGTPKDGTWIETEIDLQTSGQPIISRTLHVLFRWTDAGNAKSIDIDHVEAVQSIQNLAGTATPYIAGKSTLIRVFVKSTTDKVVSGVTGTVSGAQPFQNSGFVAYPANQQLTRNSFVGSLNFLLNSAGTVNLAIDVKAPNGDTVHADKTLTFVLPPKIPANFYIGYLPICVETKGFIGDPLTVCPLAPLDPESAPIAEPSFPFPDNTIQYFAIPVPKPPFIKGIINGQDLPFPAFDQAISLKLVKYLVLLNMFPLPNVPRIDHLQGLLGLYDRNPNPHQLWYEDFAAGGATPKISWGPEVLAPFELAHRLGHQFGLTDNKGTTGDVGFDLFRADPTKPYGGYVTFDDFLELMNPSTDTPTTRWISTANYNAILTGASNPPPAVAELADSQQYAAASPAATASEYVIVSGTVKRDGSGAQIDPVYHITTAQPQAPSQPNGNHCLQFSNGGATLGQYCFNLDVSTTVPELDQQIFTVAAPWPAGTTTMALTRGGKQIVSITRAAQDPVVTIQSPHAGDKWQGMNTIAWSVAGTAPANTLSTVFYSADGGSTWLPLVHDLSDTSYSFDTSQILGGSQVSFRVVAASGLNSGSATVGPIQVTQIPKIGASVPSIDFGNVMTGQATSRSIGITSIGSGPLTITSISVDNPAFTVLAKAPTSPVVVGGQFPLTVFLSPSASGKQSGNLTVKSNDPNTPTFAVPLTAQASTTAAASIFASATTVDFGSAPVSQNADQVVTITNTGSADLQVTAISSSDKQFKAVSPATPFTVPIGNSTDVTLRFTPSGTGSQSANITLASNDPTHSNYAISVRGTGVAASNSPQISAGGVVNGANFQGSIVRGGLATIFGVNLAAGTPASASSLPLPTVLGGTQVTVGGIPAPLVYVSQGQINFQVPFELPAGSSTQVVVSTNGASSPTAVASVADYNLGVFTYARTATALDPIIVHASTNQLVTPSNPALPNEVLVVYATGVGKLTNPPQTGGPAPSGPLAMAVDNPTITLGGAPVGALFTGLTPGFVGLVQINIQLPGNLTAASSPLVISFPGSTPASVNLATSSAASQPKLTLSASSLAYGNVTVNQSKDLSVQVSNTGSATLNVSQARVSGAGFTLLTAASFSVPAGQSTTVTVRFTPASASAFNGSLVITSNDPASPSSVSLSGSGTSGGPAITVSPASLDLGTVAVGQTSPAKPITVTNNSAASITVSLFGSGPFAVSPASLTIAANNSANASVTFAPTIPGSAAAVLNIVISGQSGPAASVALTGTATSSSANSVLKVDGGQFNTEVGYPSGASTAYFVNRLTPPAYPATITGVQLYFRTRSDGLALNTPLTVISATNPSGSSSISIFSAGTIDLISGKLSSFDQFVTYPVPSHTITSGDFLVGFMVQNPQNVFPADVDQLTPSQLRSYISSDGLSFSILDTFGPSLAGNLGVRAVVTVGK